jgi:7-cyano-7-deazaguanine reductase
MTKSKNNKNSHLLLGKECSYNLNYPDQKILQGVDNPSNDVDYVVTLSCPEFTSICPITSQPDFAHLVIDYVPNKLIIESKSLKLYLFSYRNHGSFHEDCTIKIAKDIIKTIKPKWLRIAGYWYPRGGIPIDVFYQTSTPPKNIWLKDHNIELYKARR